MMQYKTYFQIAVTTLDNQITLSINFSVTDRYKKKIEEFLFLFDKELQF